MRFVPTHASVRMMLAMSLSWPDVLRDLESVETVSPVYGSETRKRMCGDLVTAYVEPGTDDGMDCWVLVGIRARVRGDASTCSPVVGIEAPRSGRVSHGGSGSRWPHTWKDLVERLEQRGCLIVRGGKHWAVVRAGKRVATLPMTSSDHRALMNACSQLRAIGLDVRTPA